MRLKKATSTTIIVCLMIGFTSIFIQASSTHSLAKWSEELFMLGEQQTNKELAIAYQSWAEDIEQQRQDAHLPYEEALEEAIRVSSEESKREIKQYLYLYKADLHNIKEELNHPFHSYENEKQDEINHEMEQEILSFLEETLEK